MSITDQLTHLRQITNAEEARALALKLLGSSRKREVVDAALRALEDAPPDETARPVLREAFFHYADHITRDSAALVREKITRLLVHIGHHDDADVYLRGVNTYEAQPVTDVAQNLRAAALVGLALLNRDLGSIYAAKLIGEVNETSRFNGEPAMTAINLLAEQGLILPIYQFLLLAGLDALEAGQNEVAGKALESLGADFPVELYRELADIFIPRDRALVNMGIITHIVEHKVVSLYPRLEEIITGTRHMELHQYGAVMLAASRDTELIGLLFRLAKVSPQQRISSFIEALALVPGDEAQALRAMLSKR